jgi:Spy/CpxP family protein refolding chaperone
MKRFLVTLTVLGAMAATVAIAQPTPAAQAPARAHSRREMIQALDLTPAQKQQAKSIFQNTRQQVQPLIQQLTQDRQSLKAAIQSNDTAQIQQLSTAMGTRRGQVIGIRSAARAQFFALLTADKKAKASQLTPKGE